MARARWLSVDRIAAAVAATQSPQRVSLYSTPTADVLVGHIDGTRVPRHRRARGSGAEEVRRGPKPGDDGQAPLEVAAAPV
jgi:hypothetical protein